jgi:HlyD family secretion protein
MSATCDITTAEAKDIVKVPIGAVVLRDEKIIEEQMAEPKEDGAHASEVDDAAAEDEATDDEEEESKELEGIFVIEDGRAQFVEVVTGIADQQDIQIVSGLEDGQEIVTGSFRVLRELEHGSAVKSKKKGNKS